MAIWLLLRLITTRYWVSPGWGLTNTGPFTNFQSDGYWSATEYATFTYFAWGFNMYSGLQASGSKSYGTYAWAVHTGDVGASTVPVPVPAAVWLFGSGLLGLGAIARKRRR